MSQSKIKLGQVRVREISLKKVRNLQFKPIRNPRFRRRLTMVSEIVEDFEPPSKKFLATPLYLELEILRNSSTIFRSSHQRCSIKQLFLKMLWYSQENTCVGVFFKLRVFRPLTVLKRDVNADTFWWISENFKKIYFEELETATNGVL